jgi:hypothetical protein
MPGGGAVGFGPPNDVGTGIGAGRATGGGAGAVMLGEGSVTTVVPGRTGALGLSRFEKSSGSSSASPMCGFGCDA